MNTIIQTDIGKIYVWEIEDYEAKLKAGTKKRTIEKEAISQQLKTLNFTGSVQYKASGQPYFAENPTMFLSISHCQNQMALYVANQAVGIDVEKERATIFDGRSYFVNETEALEQLTIQRLHLIWGGKEAIFKQFEGAIDDLKNDVTLKQIDEKAEIISFMYNNKPWIFKYLRFDNYYLVYSI